MYEQKLLGSKSILFAVLFVFFCFFLFLFKQVTLEMQISTKVTCAISVKYKNI